MVNTRKTLAQNLVYYREQRQLSQEKLAGDSKVPRRTIQNIEYGQTLSPELDTLKGLAKALNIRVAELIGESASGPGLDFSQAADFLATVASLPLPYQQVILAIAYKDPTWVDGLPDSLGKPLQVLLKAR
jgi:transcriptional regulator with XRE-family HTH domain